jgi:hypothetical protein
MLSKWARPASLRIPNARPPIFFGMHRPPESSGNTETLRWLDYEHDAAWTAKLAILGARRREDIAHFGVCLREHDRHAGDLAALVRARNPNFDAPAEPAFLTNDASVVASIHEESALLDAMDRIESARIERYDHRRRGEDARLEALLDVHHADTRVRLAALRRLRDVRRDVAA